MKATKNIILTKLLKSAEAHIPSDDFTKIIMEQLQVNVEESLVEDNSFSELLNQAEPEIPSVNFTRNIISKLKTHPPLFHYQPLISKRISFLFAILFLVLIVCSFIINNNSQVTTPRVSSFEALNSTVNTFLQSFAQETTLIIVSIISISALLSIDYIFKKRYL